MHLRNRTQFSELKNYVGVRTGVRIASKTHPQGGIDGPAQLVGRAETVPVWDVRQLLLLRFFAL